MRENNTLRRIAEQMGPEEILCQCAEECSELAQAVLKISFVDRAHVSRIQAEKLERWDRRTRGGVT